MDLFQCLTGEMSSKSLFISLKRANFTFLVFVLTSLMFSDPKQNGPNVQTGAFDENYKRTLPISHWYLLKLSTNHYWRRKVGSQHFRYHLETFFFLFLWCVLVLCIALHYNSLSVGNQIIIPVWNLH